MGFQELHDFLTTTMSMQANYQSVIIRTLLKCPKYSAPKKLIADQIQRYNDYRLSDVMGTFDLVFEQILGESGTYKLVTKNSESNIYTLKSELLTESDEESLITLCEKKIFEYNYLNSLPKDVNFFLIQVMYRGSKELSQGTYIHKDWKYNGRASDRGLAKKGDILLVYSGGSSISNQKKIKKAYTIDQIEDDHKIFRVSNFIEFNGVTLYNIRDAIQQEILGDSFRFVGKQGFDIKKITKNDFLDVVYYDQNPITISTSKFQDAHSRFLALVESKSKQPFENFDNEFLRKEELMHKLKIIASTKPILQIENWEKLHKSRGKILQIIKNVCDSKVSGNLLYQTMEKEQNSYKVLYQIPDDKVSEFENHLYQFFTTKSESEFANVFQSLIDFIQNIGGDLDWRFFAYLAFLSDPTRYFPLTPTRSDHLLEFFEINDRLSHQPKTWNKYSLMLDLANELKLKLANYGLLDILQIQSYMWLLATSISKGLVQNYYLVRSGTGATDWQNQRENDFVGINYFDPGPLTQFYDNNGNLSDENKAKLRLAIQNSELTKGYEEGKSIEGKISQVLIQLNHFMKLKSGDKILAMDGPSKILGKGTVTGIYDHEQTQHYWHIFPVKWDEFKAKIISTPKPWLGTIKPITLQEYEEMLADKQKSQEYEEFSKILDRKKQIIFYGPPGTGKTFTANNFIDFFVSGNQNMIQTKDVKSMSDDEFKQHVISRIEKHAKNFNYKFTKERNGNQYSLQNVDNELHLAFVFSKSGKKNKTNSWIGVSDNVLRFWNEVPEENCFHIIVNCDTKNFVVLPLEIERKYAKYSKKDTSGIKEFDMQSRYDFSISINENEAKLLVRDDTYHEKYYDCKEFLNNFSTFEIGLPQSKVSIATSNFIKKVTFHPSYSYEEFIEGIRPKSHGEYIDYPIESGIFKTICKEAKNDPNNRYVLFIDEINRGNISKIFGELITLIERDKREIQSLELSYSKDEFSVPKNLFIVGTMNTADRSLVQIDAALRRRFAFYELMPKPELLTQTIEGISLKKLLTILNQRITQEGLREKQIGHSYFMDVNSLDDLHFVFTYEIVPLLQDYFFDDYKKIESEILSSDFVDSENSIIKEDWQKNSKRFLEILSKAFQS